MQHPWLLEPLMEPDSPKHWPSAQIDTVVTPFIRSLLFQLTMADPVKVMLVTKRKQYFKLSQWLFLSNTTHTIKKAEKKYLKKVTFGQFDKHGTVNTKVSV